jgi:hypothetical protein
MMGLSRADVVPVPDYASLLVMQNAATLGSLYRHWVGGTPPNGKSATLAALTREMQRPEVRAAARLRLNALPQRWLGLAAASGGTVVEPWVNHLLEEHDGLVIPVRKMHHDLFAWWWLVEDDRSSWDPLRKPVRIGCPEGFVLPADLPVFARVQQGESRLTRQATSALGTLARILRLHADLVRTGGWKLRANDVPYARDSDRVLASWGPAPPSDLSMGSLPLALIPHDREGVAYALALVSRVSPFRIEREILRTSQPLLASPRTLYRLMAETIERTPLPMAMDAGKGWRVQGPVPTLLMNLAAAATWHAEPGQWVDLLPLVASLTTLLEASRTYAPSPLPRGVLTPASIARLIRGDARTEQEHDWLPPVLVARTLLEQALTAMGLADIGEMEPGGHPVLRPTPLAFFMAGRAPASAPSTPRAWMSAADELVMELDTIAVDDIARVVSVSHSLQQDGGLLTVRLQESAMRDAMRAGVPVDEARETLMRLAGRAPAWWTLAEEEHTRHLQRYRVLQKARVEPGPDGPAVRPAAPAGKAARSNTPWTAEVADRAVTGRLHEDAWTDVTTMGLARLRRLAEARQDRHYITRASVQAALKTGLQADQVQDWLITHLRFIPRVLLPLLLQKSAFAESEGVAVRLPAALGYSNSLPRPLDAFENCRLGRDVPWLLIPHARLEAWHLAIREAGLE